MDFKQELDFHIRSKPQLKPRGNTDVTLLPIPLSSIYGIQALYVVDKYARDLYMENANWLELISSKA